MILAEKIVQLRKQNGWSQEDLAEQLGVTRQSISKYESAQSIPDLDKILLLSQIFGVSTDFLIKDELDLPTEAPSETNAKDSILRKVSLQDALDFLQIKKENSLILSFGVMLCILSPICLILLASLAEFGRIPIAEDAACGVGLCILLGMIATAVGIFISTGMKMKRFEFLEKEPFETEYGVTGMVNERKEQYSGTYIKYLIIGIIICILSSMSIFIGMIFSFDDLQMVYMVCLLLGLVGIGVFTIVRVATIQSGFETLLQEGDYSREHKRTEKKLAPFSSIYWLLTTALYLGYSFVTSNWEISWIVWPIAGILYGAIRAFLGIFIKEND